MVDKAMTATTSKVASFGAKDHTLTPIEANDGRLHHFRPAERTSTADWLEGHRFPPPAAAAAATAAIVNAPG